MSPQAAPPRPLLSQAQAPLTRAVRVHDEAGRERDIEIPVERPLTLYLDKRELVTLMTVGSAPELLALGYLRNQRLVERIEQIAAVQVDWDTQACAITLRDPAAAHDAGRRRVVTTGCGQGTVYADLMDDLQRLRIDPHTRIEREALFAVLDTMRRQDSLYKRAGSVHGCALFDAATAQLLRFTEDVGRHNAVDAISGWMWLEGVAGAGKLLYTTGRLTSEMVIKAAWMGLPILVSRSGVTEMGFTLAQRLGIALLGRAVHRHYLQYTAFERCAAPAQAAAEAGI